MPGTLQNFLAKMTRKAAADLEEALLRLPEDKRNWTPEQSSRTALDQFAECAMLNGNTVELIAGRAWNTNFDFEAYLAEKAKLSADWGVLKTTLDNNTEKVIAAILAVPDEDLEASIEMPFRPMTLSEVLAYPYWNMTYHQGQINYIASMLGCLG